MSLGNDAAEIIGREEKIEELINKLDTHWPVILLHGPKGVGKTILVKHVTYDISDPVVYIEMDEILNLRDLLSSILIEFVTCCTQSDITLDLLHNCDCDDFRTFVTKIESFTKKHSLVSKRMLVVIDGAENLLDMDPLVISGISRVHEILESRLELSFLLISILPPHHFDKPGVYLYTPLFIELPAYTKKEAELILIHHVHSLLEKEGKEEFKEASKNYIRIMLTIAYDYTRDLSVLKDFAGAHLNKYLDPIIKGTIEVDEVARLHKLIDSHLRTSSGNLGIRAISLDDMGDKSKNEKRANPFHDMPRSVKFLLISAYLASFNSKASDKRFFMKQKQQRSQRKCQVSTATMTGAKLKNEAPKAFALERLVHIFQSLLEFNANGDTRLSPAEISYKAFSCIQELIHLKLLIPMHASASVLSSDRKLRISECITREIMEKLAQSIEFNIDAHLEAEAFKK